MAVQNQFKGFFPALWAVFVVTSAVGILGLSAVERAGRDALNRVGREQGLYLRMLGAFSALDLEVSDHGHAARKETGKPGKSEVRRFQNALVKLSDAAQAGQGIDQAFADVRSAWKAWNASLGSAATAGSVDPGVHDRLRSAVTELGVSMAQVHKVEAAGIDRAARYWSLGLAFAAFIGLLAAALQGRYLDETLVRPLDRMCVLLGRVNVGETFLRIPVQRNPLLRELGRRFNRVLENLEEATEEGRRRIQAERVLAAAVAESCSAPLLILNPAGELLLCNEPGRDLVAGEEGLDLVSQLKDALREGKTVVSTRGVVYRVAASEAAAVRGFSGWVVQLRASTSGDTGHVVAPTRGTAPTAP